MMRRNSMNMCEGPLLKSMIVYAIPVMLTQILQLLFNAADLIVVGRFCGSLSVAAIGATGSLTTLMVTFFVGLSVGGSVVVARNIGAGNTKGVHRAVHTAIPLSIVCGAFLTLFGLLCTEWFMKLVDTPPEIFSLSVLYLRIYICGTIPNLVYNFGATILRAAGDTKGPLVYLTISGIANVILNLFFVLFFDMNVGGVALATAISQLISAVLVVVALIRRSDSCHLELKSMRFYGDSVKEIVKIGLPAGIQTSLFSISNVIIQTAVNSFGGVVVSGVSAAANIEGFIYTAMNAFYQATLNFVGQNAGAKKYDRVNKIVKIGLVLIFAVGITLGVLTKLFGRQLLGIYITDSTEAIEYGLTRMTYISLFYWVCGIVEITTGALRGLGVSTIPMVVSLLASCGFRTVWIFTFFAANPTLDCLYLSYPVSWGATFLIQLAAFMVVMKRIRRKEKLLEEEKVCVETA